MKKKLLSLALALALCLGLAIPVSAAGTKKVVEDETHGVKITMNEFLRTETHRYNLNLSDNLYAIDAPQGWTVDLTIYVVADNSTVTVEALPGRKYADPGFKDLPADSEVWKNELYKSFNENIASYAFDSREGWGWEPEFNCFYADSYYPWPLMEAETKTVSPSDGSEWSAIYVHEGYGIGWLCESDYAKLVPATLQTSGWAQEEVEKAWDAELMPFSPYAVDCTKGMTRAQFAAVTVRLYSAMTGKAGYWPDVSEDHPFTDVDYETTDLDSEIGMAYNLGFVKGSNTAGTLFNPKGTLTRQEAAVMLGRVYAKIHGAIPTVSNTAFADDKDVASWAKSEVAFMSSQEVVKGKGENRFAPKDTVTIQEAVIMANRMLENLK